VGPIALHAIALLWVLVGCGIDGLCAPARTRTTRRIAAGVGTAIAVAIAATLAAANVPVANHRDDTYDADYMRLLFNSLPPRAAIVSAHYSLDHMVEYQKVVTGRTEVATRVPSARDAVGRLQRRGVRVFAFGEGRALLAHEFLMAPVELFGLTLNERLRPLDAGCIVIIAGTAGPWPDLTSLGIRSGTAPRSRAVVIAVKGGGVVVQTPDGFDGQIMIPRGQPLGRTGEVAPAAIAVSTAGGQAEIRLDDEPVITSSRGLVVVELSRRVSAAYAVLPEKDMRVPVQMQLRPLFEVGAAIPPESCVEVERGEWAPLPHLTTNTLVARVDYDEPAAAELNMYLASGEPLAVALGETFGNGMPEISVEQFSQQRDERERLASRMKADGLPAAGALTTASFATRVRVRVDGRGPFSAFHVLLGGIPSFVATRGSVDSPATARARLCELPLQPLKAPAEASRTEVYLGPGGDVYFGRGWGRALPTRFGYKRKVTAREAELLLPLEAPAALEVVVGLEGTSGAGTVELVVNGSDLGSRRYPAGYSTAAWPSPGSGWLAGVNHAVLRIRGDAPPVVRRIELAPPDPGSLK
jgi:hypothetical protein